MSKKIIHVNKQHIALNVNDPSKLIYDGTQLKCGARAWIETESEIKLIDETTFKEARGIK